MNRDQKDPSDGFHPGHNNVEQSWIVLDDASGWGGNSRPPTASPSRQTNNNRNTTTDLEIDEEEEEEELASRIPRRIGMDSDVREALELAERSLEMAGTLDEFSLRSHLGNSDDDASTVRSSPASKTLLGSTGGIFVDDIYEDKYNGRAPPTISSRGNRGLIISTDAEHVAFQNIRMMTGPRSDTPVLNTILPPPQCSSVSPASSSVSNNNPYWSSQDATNDLKRDEDEGDLSFFQWAFGISSSSNFVPLVFSHVVTLLVGFYIGSRRSNPSSSSSASSVIGSPGSPQCSTSGAATPT